MLFSHLRLAVVIAAAVALSFCGAARAQAPSNNFVQQCLTGKTPASCDAAGLQQWIADACQCAQQASSSSSAMFMAISVPGGGGCTMSAAEFAAAVCAFFQHCQQSLIQQGLLPANPSCEDFIRFVECSLGQSLSPAEIEANLQCLNCNPSKCNAAPDGGFQATCPSANGGCGGGALTPCEALKKTLADAAVCFFKNPQVLPGESTQQALERALADAVCRFLTQCASGGTPPMSCRGVIQCLAPDSNLKSLLTANFLCEFLKCAPSCQADLCGFDGLPGNDPSQNCDIDGNGQINCDDLQLMIELLKACRCAAGLPPPSENDLVNLACRFYGPGGCARSAVGGNPVACEQIAACLEGIEDIPRNRYCEILSGQCAGGPAGPACTTALCAILSDPNLDVCALLGWTNGYKVSVEDLKAVLVVLRCCSGGGNLTDDQWAAVLCKLAGCMGTDKCAVLTEAAVEIFGLQRATAILEKVRAQCAPECNFADELKKLADRKRGKCDTKGAMPVDLFTGEKLESFTDLVVRLPGGDFSIERSYSSRIYGASDHSTSVAGPGWTLSTQQFVRTVPASPTTLANVTAVQIHGESANEYREFAKDVATGVFKADRADLSQFTLVVGDIPNTETTSDRAWLWQLESPGEGFRQYIAGVVSPADDPLGTGTTDTAFVSARAGLMVRQVTVSGRRDEFTYTDYGSPGWPALRPGSIYLAMFGAEDRTQARARVVHQWYQTTGAERGRLRSLSVFRGPEASAVLTDTVEYRYKRQIHDELSDDTGTAGDLIQVVARQMTDSVEGGKPLFHSKVTQYRYHRAARTPAGAPNGSPLDVVGADHQLKAVLLPEQIEFYAQRKFGQSGIGGSPDTVVLAADELLLRDDGDEAFNDVGTSRKVTDLAAKVVGYEQSGDQRVAVEFLQSSCGCTGSALGIKETYEYFADPADADVRTAVVRQFVQTGAGVYDTVVHRVTRHDLRSIDGVPYLVSRAVSAAVDPQTNDGTTWWVWGYRLDASGRETHAFMPSAIASYTPATSTTPAAFTVNTTGLVEMSVFNASDPLDHRVLERRVGSGNSTNPANYTLVERTTYLSDPMRSHLPTKVERFRWAGSTAADDVETTDYEYGFRGGSGSADLAWMKVSAEAELSSENGAGGASVTVQLIDTRGQTAATRAPDGAVRRWAYGDATGTLTSATSNATTTGLSASDYPGLQAGTGWDLSNSTPLPGGQLTTAYETDVLGRVVAVIRPPGTSGAVTTRTVRQLWHSPERPGVVYFAEVTLPHKLADGSYAGPAEVALFSAGGKTIRRSEWTVSFNAAQPQAYTLGDEIARAVADHAVTGVALESRRWQSIARNLYDTTRYVYDTVGRIGEKRSPNGSVEKFTYDLLDRVVTIDAGVASDPTSFRRIAEYYYDSAGQATQGVGDGNLTLVRQFFGGGSSDYRDSVRVYDRRNRLVQVFGPAGGGGGSATPPHEVRAYDNLDRLIERALYSQLPTPTFGGDHDDDIAAGASNRLLYARTFYSQRGMPFRTQVAVTPTLTLATGIATRNKAAFTSLSKDQWYDPSGRVVTATSPGAPATKRVYDGHGRVVESFTTDRGGPTVSNNASTGDQVVEQAHYAYDDRDRVSVVTHLRRRHDDTATRGTLDVTGSGAVRTFAGTIYDDADRVIKTVNLGTNIPFNSNDPLSVVLRTGGSAPATWPPAHIPSEAIVEQFGYDARGMAALRLDPLGRRTLSKFDDLGRQVATVENASATFDLAQDITWNASAGRWAVNPSQLSATAADVNRATSYVYDHSGNVLRLVAHTPAPPGTSGGEQVQVTEYVYGTTAPASPGPMDSLVASNDLLGEVRYPDETTGLPGTTDAFKVRYAYNRLGELRATTDQNGTRHEYARDAAGRVTLDAVTAFGTDIDTTVQAIAVTYDAAGRLKEILSTRDTAATVIDSGVGFTYTPLWQVASVVQHPTAAAFNGSGQPASGSRSVAYAYSTVAFGANPTLGDNYTRLSTLTYPDGKTVVGPTYGSGIDTRISRVSGLDIVSPSAAKFSLAAYKRVGADVFAVVDYPTIDIQLDRTWSAGDRKRRTNGWTSQNAGVYPGLDRFGRVIRQAWLDGATGSTQNGYRPAIVDQTHAYDAASNRLSRLDGREGASWANRDWEFSYDGLNRLTEARQGVRAGQTWTPSSGSQQWVLDMLGNWASQRTDLSGNGLFTDALDRLDERSLNQANELSTRVLKKGDGSATTATLPLSYDAAGQMRQEQKAANQAWRYTHDAWGRLVKVETVNTSTQAVKPISTHRFNGLHWRIAKAWHAVPDAQDKPDRKTTFWYDAAWRVVQETQRDQVNEAGTLEETIFLQFWGARYIDDAVARLRLTGDGSGDPQSGSDEEIVFQLTDAQFSVIALATPGKPSVVIDRIAYTPYGEATRTLRSDVNGDGVVNKDDYNTIIQPLIGTSIGDPAYVVEADLDRDGKITQDDYDVCIADDGQKSSGGVGEAGLFSAGVRNSVGYCGYIYNEDTGLYTVRYRTYSAVLGRWLRRDPAGYVDGLNNYAYLNSAPVGAVDPTGLFDPAGHYYGTYIAAICAGKSVNEALNLAYYAQYPDQVPKFDAYELWESWFIWDFGLLRPGYNDWMYRIMEIVHSLDGGDPRARRACLSAMIRNGKLTAQEAGTILHAYGDAFAHTYRRWDGVEVSYDAPWGHGWDSATGSCPDNACGNPDRITSYIMSLCQTLGGSMLRCSSCVGRLNLAQIPSKKPEEYLPWFRKQAIDGFGFPKDGWTPGKHTTNPAMPPITPARMSQIMKLMRCACPKVNAPAEPPRPRQPRWNPRE
jgi:RHS repeat-associated protein